MALIVFSSVVHAEESEFLSYTTRIGVCDTHRRCDLKYAAQYPGVFNGDISKLKNNTECVEPGSLCWVQVPSSASPDLTQFVELGESIKSGQP